MGARRTRDGRWRYRKLITLPNGSKVRIGGTPAINTKLEAERAEREHILRASQPAPQKKKEVPTFKDFVDEHWWPVYPNAAGNRDTTQREKEVHLRCHLKPHLGSVPLDQVRGLVTDRFFAKLKQEGLGEKTRKNIRATLRRILASAVEWEFIESLPMLPRIKVPEARFDFFSREESAVLLAAARDEEERLLILFALHTGARVSEQLAVEWGDIDWHSHKVVFRRAVIRGTVGLTKSGRERKVPLTATLEKALRRYRHMRGPLVFCEPNGKVLRDYLLLDRLHLACRRAGLRQIRWHDLRHSFASQLMSAAVPIRQVQEWLGHSTITMTMRYAHLAPGGDCALIGALDGAGAVQTWQQIGKETGAV